MARPREFDRNDVLARATQVFWLKGYEATSIQDLVDATGVNRGSLYNEFRDKAGLFAAVLDRYMADSAARKLIRAAEDGPPRATIEALFDDVVAGGCGDPARRGCLLTNTAVERSPLCPETAARVGAALVSVEDALLCLVQRGQALGEIAPWRDPRTLARFLLATIQGLRVMAKVTADPSALRDVANLALEQLD